MNTIKFNNVTFSVESYNRNIYLSENEIHGDGNCTIIVNDMSTLTALMDNTITAIQIYHDNNLIYDVQNLDAYITNINEYLSDDRVIISLSLRFDNVEGNVV